MGDGTTDNRVTPVQAGDLNDVVTVACGGSHSLALKSDGTVWAWGLNQFGELGNGTANNSAFPRPVIGLSSVTAFAAGAHHSVAAKSDGTVWAWGYNLFGQLGDGTYGTNRPVPVQVSGMSNALFLAAGYYHTLVLKSDGTVWAFGNNGSGQLGDGTTTAHYTAVQVSNLSAVRAVAAAESVSYALKADGTLWTWGGASHTPVQVSGLGVAVAVGSGSGHQLALDSEGWVWAWGLNADGQLGDGTTTNRNTPALVSAMTPAQLAISPVGFDFGGLSVDTAGQTSFVITNLGGGILSGSATVAEPFSIATGKFRVPGFSVTNIVVSFIPRTLDVYSEDVLFVSNGGNSVNTVSGRGAIVPLAFTTLASAIASNSATLNGLVNPNGLAAEVYFEWGPTVAYGNKTPLQEVGSGTLNLNVSARVDNVSSNIAYHFRLVVTNSQTSRCGNDETFALVPLGRVSALAPGENHSIALKSDGSAWAWGGDDSGQLGDGASANRSFPAQITNLTRLTKIATGARHSLALNSEGTVWVWGCNTDGQLGNGTTNGLNFPSLQFHNVFDVAAGDSFSMVLDSNGYVSAWGNNASGQIGVPPGYDILYPTKVLAAFGNITDVAGGRHHTLALKSDGTVWAWGSNTNGQLADRQVLCRYTPRPIDGLSNVVAVAAGANHSMALKSDGAVLAWGANGIGQLGIGAPGDTPIPTCISSLSNIVAVSGGGYHSIALRADGTVWTWGYNGNGQLGDGTIQYRFTPAPISGMNGMVAIACGYKHSLGVKWDGTLWAWGLNDHGQLGDGTTTDRDTPVLASGLSEPQLVARPANFSFGPLAIGATRRIGLMVGNSGGVTLHGMASTSPPFMVVSNTTFELPPLGTANVVVEFAPTNVANYSNEIVFSSDGGNATNLLSGQGEVSLLPPRLGVAPASFSFGPLAMGTAAQTTFTVSNSGDATLHGTASVAAPFAIVSNAVFTVAGWDSVNVIVSFTPFVENYSNSVVFLTDGGNSTNTITGWGAIIPTSQFVATPTGGVAPLAVSFSDNSIGTIDTRVWHFGDGTDHQRYNTKRIAHLRRRWHKLGYLDRQRTSGCQHEFSCKLHHRGESSQSGSDANEPELRVTPDWRDSTGIARRKQCRPSST